MTVRDNIAFGLTVKPRRERPSRAAIASRVDELLGLVQLDGLGGRYPAQLSGGEQQRVAIARAIAKRPNLLLCDEPTGALDSKTGVLVLEAIERIHAEIGTSTALITHNVVIADMADRVLVLADGRIAEERRNASRRAARELAW